MVKISVLMSVYKERDEWLCAAIDSILAQTFSDFEFIIVNDNPQDERLKHFLSDYAQKDSRIRIIENERNMGLVYSLNHGLQYVSGEYVARMDADDISHPDRFQKQFEYIQKEKCDLVSAYAIQIDEHNTQISSDTALHLSVECVKESLKYTNILSHTGWFVKKELFDELNGYRQMRAIEDYDFLLRACEKGKRIGMTDGVLMSIRRRDNSISSSNKLRQFLSLCFLSDNYGCVSSLTPDDLENYVSARVTPKRAENYVKATEYIRIASKAGKAKMLVYVIRALLTSRYAWKYLYCVLKFRKIRKGRIK